MITLRQRVIFSLGNIASLRIMSSGAEETKFNKRRVFNLDEAEVMLIILRRSSSSLLTYVDDVG